LRPRRVEQIIDRRGLPAETDRTITDQAELMAELENVRERGYAVNSEESIENLYAVGVAATAKSGDLIGAYSVTGSEHSLTGDGEHEMAEAVIEIVDEYELELSFAR
jgi:DNA-binding IclR family transcriptional regulator